MKIADLADQSVRGRQPDLSRQIQQLALDFNLMSAFTAFIAVDSATRTDGDPAVTVPVAVPVPAGVNPRTTVGE
jgi:Ca-activated chloride channel family protein